ncbi:MAG: hypothetical protein FD143_3772, partial [Ignavibacteria bacterium]
ALSHILYKYEFNLEILTKKQKAERVMSKENLILWETNMAYKCDAEKKKQEKKQNVDAIEEKYANKNFGHILR